MDEQGYVYIKGRSKNIIISNAMNIYPEEVEEVLTAFPGVKEALVYGALGLWSDGGQLRLSPRLPPEIRGASLCVYHRGRRLRLTIKDGQGRIEKEE